MISIIIPAYGEQLFLQKCISSIYNSLNGLKLDHEIIVVVDKKNYKAHKSKLKEFQNIKYSVSNKNMNPALARNLGSIKAGGEWLFFLDSDCELNGSYFKKLIKYVSYHGENAAFLGEVLASEREAIPLNEDYDYKKSLNKYLFQKNNVTYTKILSGANFLIKRKVFLDVGKFDENWRGAEDRELGARLYHNRKKIIYKKDLIVYHHYYLDLLSTIKRHIWHAKWNSMLYVKYPLIFKNPFRTRFRFTIGYLKKIIKDMGYFFGVIIIYNIIFVKEYLFRKIKNG